MHTRTHTSYKAVAIAVHSLCIERKRSIKPKHYRLSGGESIKYRIKHAQELV